MARGDADVAALLAAAAAAAGITIESRQIERLGRYLETLLLWRTRIALVSQKTPADIIAKHFRDSMVVVPRIQGAARVADLGSGGGFPGLVLAILCEQAEVTLVESQRRKVSFLREAVRQSAVANARVVEARAESLADHDPPFDVVVSRAVWPGSTFWEVARPLLGQGGLAIGMKTSADLPQATLTGYTGIELCPYHLVEGEERVLVLARREIVSRET